MINTEATNKNNTKRNTRKILWGALVVVALAVIVLLMLVPTFSKNYLNKNGKELLGRKVNIEKIKLNYLTSTVRIIGFQFFEQNENDVFVAFDTLKVNIKPLRLLRNEIYVQQFQLVNSKGNIVQNGEVFNFSDLMEFYSSDSTAVNEEANTEKTEYKLNLNNIELKKGSLLYTDEVLNHSLNMENVSFHIPEIHWSKPDSSKAAVQLNLPDGGHLLSALNYNVESGKYKGWAELKNINLKMVEPYIQQYLKVSDVNGIFSTKILFNGDRDNSENLDLSGTAKIDKLLVNDLNQREVIGGEQFYVELQSAEPLKQQINIDLIELTKPYVHVALIDSLSNLEKMLVPLEGEAPADSSENTLNISVNDLKVSEGFVDLTYRYLNEDLLYEMANVNVDMDTLHWLAGEGDIRAHFLSELRWNDQDSSKMDSVSILPASAQISSTVNYSLAGGIYKGDAKVEGLNVDMLLPYLNPYFIFSEFNGKLSSDLTFEGNQADVEALRISGTAQLDSLLIKDESNRKIVGGEQFMVEINSAEPLKQIMDFELIKLNKPYVYFALIDSTSNFENILVPSEEASVENESTPGTLQLSIGNLLVNGGLIDFSDQRFREEFLYELSDLTIDMDTLEINDDWVNINADMKLNKRGKLKAQIGMNPFAVLDSIQLDYVLSDFQLPDLNMYSKEYVGIPILFGDMYYVNSTSIINRKIESNNEFIIRNVEMGRKSGGMYNLPIKLALFILKDRNGDITLDVPVSGDLSDPQAKIGAIVWDTFTNFLTKVATAPFASLGKLFGVSSEELEEISFDYGDEGLQQKQIKSLNTLLEIEKEKPELQIELRYINDKRLERVDVARQISHQFFYQEKAKKASANKREYVEFLEEKTGKDSLVMQDYELLLAPETMIDSVIAQNEIQRVENVRTYLKSKNASSTIRIFEFNANEVLNIGSRPKFLIRYLLAEDEEELEVEDGI